MTAAYELEDAPDEAGAPRPSTTETAEIDAPASDPLAMTTTSAGEPPEQDEPAALDLASEPEIPEAIESSEILDDAALESVPDAEEIG